MRKMSIMDVLFNFFFCRSGGYLLSGCTSCCSSVWRQNKPVSDVLRYWTLPSSGTNLLQISSIFGLLAPCKETGKQEAIVGFVSDTGQGAKREMVFTGRKWHRNRRGWGIWGSSLLLWSPDFGIWLLQFEQKDTESRHLCKGVCNCWWSPSWSTAFLSHLYISQSPFVSTGVELESYGTVQGTACSHCACIRAQVLGLVGRLRPVRECRSLCAVRCNQWRTEGGFGVFNPPPEIPKALQNRTKFNPIVKTVKNFWISDANTPRCSEKRQ